MSQRARRVTERHRVGAGRRTNGGGPRNTRKTRKKERKSVGADGEEFDELGEDAVAVAAGEGEGELREEQAVGRADVVAAAGDGQREVAAAGGEGVKGGREAEGPVGCGGVVFVEDREEVGAEDVETEEAEVKPGPQAGYDELLFGGGGRGLFEDGVDLVERAVAADEFAADGTVGGELALAGRLDGGDGGVLGDGDVDELAGAARGAVGDVEVIADEVKERLVAHEVATAEDGVAVAARGGLGDETHS